MVVELIDRSSSVSPEFAKIRRVIFVHLFSKADVVVAADAAALVFAEKNGPVIFADGLVILAESACVSLEKHKGVLSLVERRVYCSFSFCLIEPCLAENLMHELVAFSRFLGLCLLLHHHFLHRLLIPTILFLLRLFRLLHLSLQRIFALEHVHAFFYGQF